MEQLISLYRILISVSAAALLFGLILMTGRFVRLRNSQKQLYILAVVNLASMVLFLFGARSLYESNWKELILFIETLVLVLNFILAYFIQQSVSNKSISFANQAKQTFLVSFISVCVYFSIYYILGGDGRLLERNDSTFPWVFGFSLLLVSFGSFVPGIKALLIYFKGAFPIERKVCALVILNALNNMIGLVFFTLEFPNRSSSIVMNIVANLIFAYYLAYYFLSEFFKVKPAETNTTQHSEEYNWNQLSKQLTYWNDTKAYLNKFYADLVKEVDELPLSDLEKTHLILKRLNIKSKDIANAMAVSVKAVEMQRYRIKKKLEE